jgi:site-specific recombinase XerC
VRAKYTLFEDIESKISTYLSYKHGYTDLQEACGKDEPLFKGNSGEISYNAVYQDFTKRVANIDIDKKLSPKQIRHSRATHLDRSGHDTSSIVRNQLVHSPKTDLSSTYIHEGGEEYVREPMTIDGEEE